MPTTPAKSVKSRSSAIYSPVANVFTFDSQTKKVRNNHSGIKAKFSSEFSVEEKIGEGSFGEAFKVLSNIDSKHYAIKKSKQKYNGQRDRDLKLEEVQKALYITNCHTKFKSSVVQFYEAWEETGTLYIRSELCERGNLDEYLVQLEQ